MYAVARFYGYMRDSEVVAAIVAGDPDGLAEAYDRYAAPLYTYCRSLLREPADAADAVQDTFVIAASKLAGLRDRNRLRPWLYAVARNECHRRLREVANEAPSALDAVPDVTDESADVTGGAERAGLRTLLRSAVRGLNAGEQDLIELQLRQELDVAEIAAVLGVSRNHAHALLSRARDQLEISLGALLVARSGRADCAALGALLEDWDGQLNVLMRKRINRHIERCPACAERKRRELAPALLLGLAPLAALPVTAMPAGLRAQILRLASSNTPEAMAHRASVVQRTAPFGEHGFPKPLDPPKPPWWRERRGQAIVAAAVIIATAAALTGLALAGGLSAQPGRPSALSQASGPGGSAAAAAGTTLGVQASGPGPSARPTGPASGAARVSPSPAAGGLPAPAASPPALTSAPPAHHSTSPGPATSPASTPAASTPAASSTAADSTAASSTAASTASSTATPTFTLIPGTLRVTPTTIVLSPPLGGTLTLTASGGPVTWSITESSALIGEVTVSPSSGRLAAGQSATVSVSASDTVAGQSVAAALGTVSAVSVDGRLAVNPGGITVTVVIDLGSQSPGSPSPSSPSPSSPSLSPSSPSPSSPSQSIPPADALGPARLAN
jgi:RNA polymerase sigma factor (sigma-70 family)